MLAVLGGIEEHSDHPLGKAIIRFVRTEKIAHYLRPPSGQSRVEASPPRLEAQIIGSGLIELWIAIAADMGVTLVVIANALRLLNVSSRG